MKITSKDSVYRDGRLYDLGGREIRIKEGAEVKIIGLEEIFLGEEYSALSASQLEKKLNKFLEKKEITGHEKILSANSYVYFKLKQHDEIFKVELLEDLYLIYKDKLQPAKQISLHECVCTVINPQFVRTAGSLNDLYKRVYNKHYGDEGASTVNAFARFFTDRELRNPINTLRETWRDKLKRK